MKIAWLILAITAFTDFVIAFGTGLLVGNAATGATYPSGPTMVYSAIGALVVSSRTVQQALKATPEQTAALKGEPPPVVMRAIPKETP